MSIKLKSTSGGSVSLDTVSSQTIDTTLTLPDSVGSANQLLKNGSTAGQLEYGLTLPSGNGSAGQYLRNTGTPGTLEFGDLPSDVGEVVQVKGYMTGAAAQYTAPGYIWGGGNNGAGAVNGRIQFTPVSTSNQLILISSITLGNCNLNGGLLWLINGQASADFYKAQPNNAYAGGSTSYTGAWSTADDGLSANTDYDIGYNTISLITKDTYTLPSSIDFGFYYHEGQAGGYVNFNRQHQDNNGRGISSLVIYEVQSA